MLADSKEPVLNLDVIKAAVSALVLLAWQAAPSPVVEVAATVGGLLIFAACTWLTRRLVTPLADPKDATGQPLVAYGRHAREEG